MQDLDNNMQTFLQLPEKLQLEEVKAVRPRSEK